MTYVQCMHPEQDVCTHPYCRERRAATVRPCRCGGLASGECARCGRDLVLYDLAHVDTGDDLICTDCL